MPVEGKHVQYDPVRFASSGWSGYLEVWHIVDEKRNLFYYIL